MHAGILIRSFAVELQEQLRGSRSAASDFIKEREERLLQLIKELTSLISLRRRLSLRERTRDVDVRRHAGILAVVFSLDACLGPHLLLRSSTDAAAQV